MRTNQDGCPYLNRDDERCNKRLTLVHLPQAFSFCVTAYCDCAVYQQLRLERSAPEAAGHLVPSA